MIFIDNDHAINFRHSYTDNPDGIRAKTMRMNIGYPILQSRRTECEILKISPGESPVVLAYGESMCHPFDNFNKELGRKNALTRAVKFLSRDQRKKVWTAYFNR